MNQKQLDNIDIEMIEETREVLSIEFIPYNKEITLSFIKTSMRYINDNYILREETRILGDVGFVFDGLRETSWGLIKNGCTLYNEYTSKSIRL